MWDKVWFVDKWGKTGDYLILGGLALAIMLLRRG